MSFVAALWLPIIVASVLVFLAGSVIWMILPHHRNDWTPISDDRISSLIREQGLWGGQYIFPAGAMSRDPEAQARTKGEPAGFLLTRPAAGAPMSRTLSQYFAFILVTMIFVAYLTHHALGTARPDYAAVFRMAGTSAFLVYGLGVVPNAIFWGHKWRMTWLQVMDGLIYAIIIGGAFAWLWPD